jgi:hypothetical protein
MDRALIPYGILEQPLGQIVRHGAPPQPNQEQLEVSLPCLLSGMIFIGIRNGIGQKRSLTISLIRLQV